MGWSVIVSISMLSAGRAFVPAAARTPFRAPTSRTMMGGIMDLLGGRSNEPGLIAPEQALPGRSTPMPNINNHRHIVLGNKLEEVPDGHEVAVFANGCFWGSEKGIWRHTIRAAAWDRETTAARSTGRDFTISTKNRSNSSKVLRLHTKPVWPRRPGAKDSSRQRLLRHRTTTSTGVCGFTGRSITSNTWPHLGQDPTVPHSHRG